MPALLHRLKCDAHRTLYGAPGAFSARPTPAGRLLNGRFFLLPALVPVLLGLGICALVIGVDPFNLRPWGLAPRLSDSNYPELVAPKLVRAVAAQHEDVVLLGGSQAMGVTTAQLRRVFGEPRTVNLAYSLVRERDAAALMKLMVRTPGLKHLIVELPFTAMSGGIPPAPTGSGALAVLGSRWYALPDFDQDIARASLNRLRQGRFALPSWEAQARDYLGSRSLLDNPSLRVKIDEGFSRVAAAAFERSLHVGCAEFPLIRDGIVPAAREAAARGVALDFYFPPIPAESYPRAETENPLLGSKATFFDRLMSFHRCAVLAVQAAAGRNVRVDAIDLDPDIIGNLANYKDTFHLVRPDKFEQLLVDIRDGRYVLTPAKLDAYEGRLRAAVLSAYARRAAQGR